MCCIGRWTVDELKYMIALLQQADFDPTGVDTDLHKRVSAAIQDGFIMCCWDIPTYPFICMVYPVIS